MIKGVLFVIIKRENIHVNIDEARSGEGIVKVKA